MSSLATLLPELVEQVLLHLQPNDVASLLSTIQLFAQKREHYWRYYWRNANLPCKLYIALNEIKPGDWITGGTSIIHCYSKRAMIEHKADIAKSLFDEANQRHAWKWSQTVREEDVVVILYKGPRNNRWLMM
jgi:hypothetical protein